MAFPPRDFRSLSEQDFARLSTLDKFRHIHLGLQELARALAELDSVMPGDRPHGN